MITENITIPISNNDVPIPALSPIGPHASAPAQSIDNTKVYTFPVPEGAIVRISCSQSLNVRTRSTGAAAPTLVQLQTTGYVQSGAALVIRSLGAIDVASSSSSAVSWAPDVLVGAETDD